MDEQVMKYSNTVAVISGEIMYQTLLAADLIRGRNYHSNA